MPSIDDFLRSGHLGVLSAGMSMDQVRQLVGEPESVSVLKNPMIWKYGSLQLVFSKLPYDSDPALISIVLYFHNPAERPPVALALNGWIPSGETTDLEFRVHLEEVGIRVRGEVTTEPAQHLILESADRVTFDEGRLYSIGYTAKREPKFKQYTINIWSSDLEALRREAAIHGISIAALCSRWIEERAVNLQPH